VLKLRRYWDSGRGSNNNSNNNNNIINQSINLPRDQGQPPWLPYSSMGTWSLDSRSPKLHGKVHYLQLVGMVAFPVGPMAFEAHSSFVGLQWGRFWSVILGWHSALPLQDTKQTHKHLPNCLRRFTGRSKAKGGQALVE
jgi:hypothetical protein